MSNCCVCNRSNRANAKFCANCRAPIILQDKYRITKLLGSGGYGAVYLAEQLHLGGVPCAVKELTVDPKATPQQAQQAAEQFRLEANLLAGLNHPALPRVTDFFTEGSRHYLVMEYVAGDTLEERLTRNRAPLSETQVHTWAQELCDVLTYLHTCQPSPVIHRDVKPSNIKITPDGRLKLIDFGISKVLAKGTKDAARAVSPPYSPLEQYGKGVSTDARSDIYALGVTLYELLTNRLPPEAPDRASESVIRLRQLNPALAPNTEAMVLKAIAEKPAERFQSAAEMKRALTTPTYQQPVPTQPSVPYATPVPAYPLPSSAAVQKRGISGWVWLAVVVVIGFALLAGVQEISRQQAAATATAIARATAAAQAQMTATAGARATATVQAQAQATALAQARATATVQSVRATATALAQRASKVYGPVSGSLSHQEGYITSRDASVSLGDFIAEVRFYNPYSRTEKSWDYGILFRSAGGNQNYRLSIDSDGDWSFRLVEGDPNASKRVAFGVIKNFDLSASGSNLLRIVVRGTNAFFFVNGDYVATLDTSDKIAGGDVSAGTGFFGGNQMIGKSTRYESFTVWSLP